MVASAGLLAERARSKEHWRGQAVAVGSALVLILTLVGLVADDLRAHRALPHESAAAHAYMTAMVHDDPGGMWATYSASARQARGGNEAAFVAYMHLGTEAPSGPANRFALVAAVPLESDATLLYYRVTLDGDAAASHVLVPVVVDQKGAVEDAGEDGLYFVPPRNP